MSITTSAWHFTVSSRAPPLDAVADPIRLAQRVTAAGVLVPADEHLVARLEEHDADPGSVAATGRGRA